MFKRILTYSILTLIALGGFFGNIVTQKGINTDSVISMSYETSATYAASGTTTPSSAELTKGANAVVDALNIILGFVTLVISPAILFAGWLMSPDWTSGDLFGLRTPMYALWVTVSNIVYFIYAILLILIALGTMFGQDKFSYKVMLPKLALGILMVPFTWWFVQWTISISSVITASVITIPMETISKDDAGWMSKPSVPKKITITEKEDKGKIDIEKCGPTRPDSNCIAPIDFLSQQSGMYGHMMVYAYSIFKFDQVRELSLSLDSIKTVTGIIHQGLIAVLMFLVFGLLTLALVAMLLVRAIKLWVYAIFSPLFTFRFVAGSNLMGGSDDTFSIKEFVGLCFVPAIVGLTLSFGLILINAVSSGTVANDTKCDSGVISGKGCDILKIMGSDKNKITRKVEAVGTKSGTTTNTITWGDMTIDFIGKAGASKDPVTESTSVNGTTSVLNSAGGIFGTLIIDIIALVFIWMAFMAAKNVSKAVSMAVEPFEKIGKQVGSLAQSIPKYTPIPGVGMSANSMSKIPQGLESAFAADSDKKFKESKTGKWLEGMNPDASVNQQTLSRIKQAGNTDDSFNAITQYHKGFIDAKNGGEGKGLYTNPDMVAEIKKLGDRLEKGSIKDSDLKNKYGVIEGTKLMELLKDKGNFDKNKERIAALLAGGSITDSNSVTSATKFLEKGGQSNGKNSGETTDQGFEVNKVKGNGSIYAIKLNGLAFSTDISNDADPIVNQFSGAEGITPGSLGTKTEFKRKIIEGLNGKVGNASAEKIADKVIKELGDNKFS